MISSDLCNAIKKILDKISFHRHFKEPNKPSGSSNVRKLQETQPGIDELLKPYQHLFQGIAGQRTMGKRSNYTYRWIKMLNQLLRSQDKLHII